MAAFHGRDGKVQWDIGGTEAALEHCTNWTCDITVDTAETTVMGDTWKSRVPGYKDWTATAECFMDSTGMDVPIAEGGTEAIGENTPATLELWMDKTGGAGEIIVIHGSAICTDASINQDANDAVKVTYTFEGQGTLTWATTNPSA